MPVNVNDSAGARLSQAFTLLEITIVLVIIGFIIGGAMVTLSSYLQSSAYNATLDKMATIDKAMLDFTKVNGRLPCPSGLTYTATSQYYGVEATPPGYCSTTGTPAVNFSYNQGVAEGGVPTRALRLPDSFMYDGYGRRLRYAVHYGLTNTGAFTSVGAGSNCGNITINDSTGAARTTNAIYVLLSHGANGHGAYTSNGIIMSAGSTNANEQLNCHCNSSASNNGLPPSGYSQPTYVQALPTYSTTATNSFDDILTYKERWQLQTPGDGPPNYLYVADMGTYARIQKFNGCTWLQTIGGGAAASSCTSSSSCTITTGTGLGEFNNNNINGNFDSSGNLWIADYNNQRIQEYTSTGTLQTVISNGAACNSCTNPTACGGCGTGNSGNGRITNAISVFPDKSGNIWEVDTGNNRVQKLSRSGTWLMTIGGGPSCVSCTSTSGCTCSSGTADGYFNTPYAVAVDSLGNIWVVDEANNRIQKFSPSGNWLLTIGGGSGCAGTRTSDTTCSTLNGNAACCAPNAASCTCTNTATGIGLLNQPKAIALDAANNLYVAEYGNSRIQKFDQNGNWLQAIGGGVGSSGLASCTSTSSCTYSSGCNAGMFANATGISIDTNGNIWVGDKCHRVQEFNNSGNWVESVPGNYTSTGSTGNGQFISNFTAPIPVPSSLTTMR